MSVPKKILVFHPGAIGDVMLASPVAVALKNRFPSARLVYMTHPVLAELVACCRCVDEVVPYAKEKGLLALRRGIKALDADLIVDLAGSPKSFLATFAASKTVVRYRKEKGASAGQHAAENFLATLKPLELGELRPAFPTIEPPPAATEAVAERLAGEGADNMALIALVPGVGKLRPHRAWIAEGWAYLVQSLAAHSERLPVLVGGSEEVELCRGIESEAESRVVNLCGQLSLIETAALLKRCAAVVCADTGPAHLAVAVGVPVVGLYGPTYPARSGPYGCQDYLVDHSEQCLCHDFKSCRYLGEPEPGPGECMRQIMLEEVAAKLEAALAAAGKPLQGIEKLID